MSDQAQSRQAATTPHWILILEAIRCWRKARDDGHCPQPCLFRALAPHDADFIVPAIDSVMAFYESYLGRAISVGDTITISDDESWLLASLIDVATEGRSTAQHDSTALMLECAIQSMRALLQRHPSAPQSLDFVALCASRRAVR